MSDLIRREDVMALWDKYHYEIATKAVEFDKDLREIPSAQPKHGKWKAKSFHEFFCDNCGFSFDMMMCDFLENMNFCPNCGADMRTDR